MDPFADRGQQDHGGNPDSDPEEGQKAAQAVCSHGAQGELQSVSRADHGIMLAAAQRFDSDCTGSSRAARRAGSTPNRMPVPSAVPSPASTAQSGGKAGNSG